MSIFEKFLSACIDQLCSPPEFHDPCSSAHAVSTVRDDRDSDWHSNHGMMNDWQVPAESSSLFDSTDWSSGNDFGGCSFGGSAFD